MIYSMLVTAAGLDRVTDWAVSKNTRMRILHVMYEPDWDQYAVLVDCSERDVTYLSLLEH